MRTFICLIFAVASATMAVNSYAFEGVDHLGEPVPSNQCSCKQPDIFETINYLEREVQLNRNKHTDRELQKLEDSLATYKRLLESLQNG